MLPLNYYCKFVSYSTSNTNSNSNKSMCLILYDIIITIGIFII